MPRPSPPRAPPGPGFGKTPPNAPQRSLSLTVLPKQGCRSLYSRSFSSWRRCMDRQEGAATARSQHSMTIPDSQRTLLAEGKASHQKIILGCENLGALQTVNARNARAGPSQTSSPKALSCVSLPRRTPYPHILAKALAILHCVCTYIYIICIYIYIYIIYYRHTYTSIRIHVHTCMYIYMRKTAILTPPPPLLEFPSHSDRGFCSTRAHEFSILV